MRVAGDIRDARSRARQSGSASGHADADDAGSRRHGQAETFAENVSRAPSRAGARPVMLMGCTSDAGKSFLAAGVCRLLANRGWRVAPFKAQNMSNHAAVTPDGREIGRAQYLQALAARVTPEARMNPVLLKPMRTRRVRSWCSGGWTRAAGQKPWGERAEALWPIVRDALHGLLREHELLVIEGAGSPAEVNLRPPTSSTCASPSRRRPTST